MESHILHVAVSLSLEPWFQCLSEERVLAAIYHSRVQKDAQGLLWKSRVTWLYFSVQSTWSTKALLKSLANVSF